MNDTPNPTAEQIAAEAIADQQACGSCAGAPPYCGECTAEATTVVAALRAHGLLSEGAPSDEQIERAARAFFREYHGEDIWPELRDDGELDTRSRALAATRAALVAAGVAPQVESTDHEKLTGSVTCGECTRPSTNSISGCTT